MWEVQQLSSLRDIKILIPGTVVRMNNVLFCVCHSRVFLFPSRKIDDMEIRGCGKNNSNYERSFTDELFKIR